MPHVALVANKSEYYEWDYTVNVQYSQSWLCRILNGNFQICSGQNYEIILAFFSGHTCLQPNECEVPLAV